jgi:hypothetical protein
VIDGNAFHHVGYNDSGTSSISGAVQVANACHGTTSGVVVSNNLMWDLGGGGILVYVDVEDDADFRAINNTIWDYGNQTPVTLGSHAITCYDDGCNGDVRNNIVLDPANPGINPLNRGSGWATADNLCETGSECGADPLTGSSADALDSIDPEAASFLFPAGDALDGAVLPRQLERDYLGGARSEPTDVGAIEQ